MPAMDYRYAVTSPETVPSENGYKLMEDLLIVFVGGLDRSLRHFRPLLDELQKEPVLIARNAKYLEFDQTTYRIGLRRLANVADRLAAKINQKWITHGGFQEILFIGHSVGGLLLREAYLSGYGEAAQPRYSWAGAVSRIVLLAAPNRGLSRLSFFNYLGDRSARLFLPFVHFTYQDIMEGSVFVTNLRLRWIRHFGTQRGSAKLPQILQLRGDDDADVSAADSLDVLAFPEGLQVPVPDADHHSIAVLPTRLAPDNTMELTDVGRAHYNMIRSALLAGPESLGINSHTTLAPKLPPPFEKVVIILHGIRARNVEAWLSALARQISQADPKCKVVRPSYGYFSALRFILPSVRRRNIRLLLDQYTQHLAANPDAEFHFIGHSNGTYMFGRSLQQIPAMRFNRVVLAGSVLPTDIFSGNSQLGKQVTAVRNDGARFDWPVGILCRILRNTLFLKDVGAAGYDGFDGGFVKPDFRYHPGGHGDMFTAENVRSIVSFILDPFTEQGPSGLPAESAWFGFISRLSPFLVGMILICLIFYPAIPQFHQHWLPWEGGVAMGIVSAAIILDTL